MQTLGSAVLLAGGHGGANPPHDACAGAPTQRHIVYIQQLHRGVGCMLVGGLRVSPPLHSFLAFQSHAVKCIVTNRTPLPCPGSHRLHKASG